MVNRSSDLARRPNVPGLDSGDGGWGGSAVTQRIGRAHELSIAELLAAVESELIPRLSVPSIAQPPSTSAPERAAPDLDDWAVEEAIARFATWSVESDAGRLRTHVFGLLERGAELDAIYLRLVAPAARHLGELWNSDEVSFVDVQLGLCRLHRLVCECHEAGRWFEPIEPPPSILLASAPKDQHTFGVTLAADFFRRRGWQVTNLCGLEERVVLERLADEHFCAAGFSLHNEQGVGALATLIERVRRCTRNPDLLVLVGGDFFVRKPSGVAEVGADLTASDAYRAVQVAEIALRGARSTA